MSSRRELTAAVLGAVLAGGLALVAGGQSWARVTVDRSPPLPPVTGVLNGADVAPLVPATGLVLLAAAVALLAVRGAGRVVVGLLMAAAGLLVVLRGRSWPGMGRRYERPGSPAAPARPQTDEDRAQAAWRALDRGEDPTADPSGDQRGGPEIT